MALHRAGSGAAFACSGTRCSCASSIRRPGSCCASTYEWREGPHRIQDDDRSRKTPRGIHQLLTRADGAGVHVGQLCRAMHALKGESSVRRIQGVLSLARKYGVAAVEDACCAALERNIFEYAFVRRYLERTPAAPLSLRQVDPLIRQLTLYRDVVERKTQENNRL